MTKLAALLVVCVALTLAACGDDDDDAGGGTDEAVMVDMKDFDFVPEHITVAAGTTVRWTNSDLDPYNPHTVTKEDGPGPDFDSGRVEPGDEYEQTFEEPGRVEYTCTLHPMHEGTITVE